MQEQDSQVVQGQVQERVVEEEVQNLTVEHMIPPIRFRRGGLRSQIIYIRRGNSIGHMASRSQRGLTSCIR